MINTLNPGAAPGHDAKQNEALERISRQYGKPDDKQREAVKKLGKDEFFKIMITQIQHQDPLKPAQNEEMAAQMAQFSSLEQMMNVNTNLEKLTLSQMPLQQLGAANLIGKHVTADAARFVHTEGKFSGLNFDLPADATRVRVAIVNDRGETVKEIEKHNLKKGPVSIDWDGKRSNNMLASGGQYMMQISAENERGQALHVQTTSTQIVHGVGMDGKDTILYTGDIAKPTRMLLRNVTKIIDASQGGRLQSQPGSVTGPGGMQIGGLENVLGGAGTAEGNAAAAAAGGAFPNGMQVPEEATVEGAHIGRDPNMLAVNPEAMKKANEQPVYTQPPSPEELRQAMAARNDLTGANLAAQALSEGKPLNPGQVSEIAEINPAAQAMGIKAAEGQPVPSGAEGSTAGKWSE